MGGSVVCFIPSKVVAVGLLCIVTRLAAKAIFEEVGVGEVVRELSGPIKTTDMHTERALVTRKWFESQGDPYLYYSIPNEEATQIS